MNNKFISTIKKNNKFWMFIPYFLISIILVLIPLIIVVIRAFTPAVVSSGDGSVSLPVSENWNFIDYTVFEKILLSIGIAFVTSLLCLVIGYPFAYFLSLNKNKCLKILTVSIVISPIWMSFLIKLVSLKTLFDLMNGSPNSTYGNIYSIIALVYINLPIFILTIYTYINSIPKNLLDASKDLGKNSLQTFFFVIVPYTKNAIMSGLTLVFLPSITVAGVSKFMNNSNDGELVGDIIVGQGQSALVSNIALSRVSALCIVLCAAILILFAIFLVIRKVLKVQKSKRDNGGVL
ncbi:ABC transporter permease [Malacoplasma iowae]|uniref:ABC transporter permease subunit n=1 Tax=Malacoplasma iowae 695 TaxID=1048830 RepID=A0A6P1LC67_MALIO|nr:ABC transporter permease subunit [Malacoplasma iowae]QHG89777.2 ABC transporter permease subunit [Malacoplasma iowae 695]WPL35422.1 ABC transporter permease subunit [Malacoplasma iowae]VEU62404.1 polyamine (spermidine/putrescine) ABC transporter permease [Mycoplasmopsis fermentans]VEU72336.1 polyamine (spermidine/putrescine) ABC transporter permease [Malacoplasma iowae]